MGRNGHSKNGAKRFVPGESFAESRPSWTIPSGLGGSSGPGPSPGSGSGHAHGSSAPAGLSGTGWSATETWAGPNPPQYGFDEQSQQEEWLGWGTSQPRIPASSTAAWNLSWEMGADESSFSAEAQVEVVDPALLLITDDALQSWTSKEALGHILRAPSDFEVLGLQPSPRPFGAVSMLKKRFRRLSLLTHPDKNPEPTAVDAFRRLSDAMRVLCDEEEQAKLIKKLFPDGSMGLTASYRGSKVEPPPPPPAPAKSEEEQEEDRLKAELREKEELERADAEWRRRRDGFTSMRSRQKPFGNPAPTSSSAKEPGAKKRRQGEQPSWGLPQAFQPPTSSSGGTSGTAGSAVPSSVPMPPAGTAGGPNVNPQLVWELTGAIGLANNGWERLESTRHPGHFYFLHKASGRTVVASKEKTKPPPPPPSASLSKLPADWERRESRSRPGTFYFVNRRTGETSLKHPTSGPTQGAAQGSSAEANEEATAPQQQSSEASGSGPVRDDLSEGESELGDEQENASNGLFSAAGIGSAIGQNFVGRHVVYGLSANSCHRDPA